MSWSSLRTTPSSLTWWNWLTASSSSCSERGQSVLGQVRQPALQFAVECREAITHASCFCSGTDVRRAWCRQWTSETAFASTKQLKSWTLQPWWITVGRSSPVIGWVHSHGVQYVRVTVVTTSKHHQSVWGGFWHWSCLQDQTCIFINSFDILRCHFLTDYFRVFRYIYPYWNEFNWQSNHQQMFIYINTRSVKVKFHFVSWTYFNVMRRYDTSLYTYLQYKEALSLHSYFPVQISL